MFTLSISQREGEARSLSFDIDEISIGRVQSNDIVLKKKQYF